MACVVLLGADDRDAVEAVAHALTLAGHEVLVSGPSADDLPLGPATHRVGSVFAYTSRPSGESVELSPLHDCAQVNSPSAPAQPLMNPLRPGLHTSRCTQRHAIARWARIIVDTVLLDADPRTLDAWGRSLGVSTGALRNWCSTARFRGRRSLLFARMLRAVAQHEATGVAPEDLLDITDRRTLVKLLALSGGTAHSLPVTLDDFLDNQRLIDRRDAITQVRQFLSDQRRPTRPPARSSRGFQYRG